MRDAAPLHGQPLVATLNDLVQLDYDAIISYEHAIAHCDDAAVRRDLELFAGDHEQHIVDLGKVIRACGGTPIDAHRDLKGLVLETLTTVRSLGGTLSALRAMRTAENLTNRVYRKAAAIWLAPIGRVVIDQNYADEVRHLAVIESHIERMSGTAVVTSTGLPMSTLADPAHSRRW